MSSVRGAIGVLAVAVFVSGCDAYDESLLSHAVDPGCEEGSARPPEPPRIADSPAEDDVQGVVFALKDVILDTNMPAMDGRPLWRTTGFNVDRLCSSSQNQIFACKAPGTNPMDAVDGDLGIDNVFGAKLFPLVDLQYSTLIQAQMNADPNFEPYADNLQGYAARVQEEGHAVLLLRISGWNGTPNDPVVRVDLTQSVYGAPGTATEAPVYQDGDVPSWQGDDWFWVRDDTFVNQDLTLPKIFDTQAYLTDGKIVVHLPDRAELVFVGPTLGLRMAFTDAVGVGVLSEDMQRLEQVIIGGRWSKTDLLQTARAVNVCPGTSAYTITNEAVDNMLDLRSVPSSDRSGQPCDALSIGISFKGFRAHIAGIVPGPNLPDPCTP